MLTLGEAETKKKRHWLGSEVEDGTNVEGHPHVLAAIIFGRQLIRYHKVNIYVALDLALLGRHSGPQK